MSRLVALAQIPQITSEVDLLWVITASALVFLMQGGFLALEAGLTRTKNAINVAIKNLADFGVSVLVFWLFGFGIMFGATANGWFGTDSFALSFAEDQPGPSVFFLFQVMFAGTAVTIVSGAVAERLRFLGYLFIAVLVAGFTYAIFGHWAWNGGGWLAERGFVDFAGSSVVHSVGGWTALAVLLVIGPRIGRFPEDGPPRKIQGNNLPLASLGVLLLFIGWLGFNGGSTLAVGPSVGRVLANTVLAGAAGLVAATALGYRFKGRAEIDYVFNGALGGLVAITANAHAVDSIAAVVIGALGGFVVIGAMALLERFRIDDAVGAVPVHLAAGIWGTLATGIFGETDLLGTGLTRFEQIGVQALGVVACFVLVFIVTYLVVRVIDHFEPFRVSRDEELVGLNVSEHGATSELLDFVRVIDTQATTGDLSLRAPVEPFTEVGQIATQYNAMMDKLEDSDIQVKDYQEHLEDRVAAQTVELRDANRKVELALEQLESTDTIIARYTLDGVIVEMNQFGLDLFGFSADEVIGRDGFESYRLPGGGWEEELAELIANPGKSADSETECRKSDGTPIWVEWRNSPIVDDDNNIIEVVSIGIDITERREMEVKLKEAKDRMEEELNIGRDIQMSMLPLKFPAFPDRREFSIHAMLEPAREVGGDFYDFFLIDDVHLCFCVGDVSDKGVPAALFMAVTKTLITSHASADWSPASIMTAVNDELCVHNESSMFVTIFLCILDLRNGELVYTSAGHNPPYVKTSAGELIRLDQYHGLVAGAVPGVAYGEDRIRLGTGDYVILFTDGVTEAMNVQHELFSGERLESLLQESTMVSTEQTVATIFDSVVSHQGAAEQSDDITILTVAFQGTPDTEHERLEIVMANNFKDLSKAMATIGEFVANQGLDDIVRRPALLAVDDLLNNIVSYAYNDEVSRDIEIIVEISNRRLAITIADDGVPFNPFGADTPDIQAALAERKIGGLGIHLVRKLMDYSRYDRRGGRNVVTVAKYLDPEDEGTQDGNQE